MARIFQEVPLDPSRKETRLFKLLPGDYEEEVRVELFAASVELETPTFKAISHAWDLKGPQKYISVNGSQFEISQNVFSATHAVNYWIDTICINQADIPERNSQVLLMSNIFSKSSKVLVWLGDGNENTNVAITGMHLFKRWTMYAEISSPLLDPKPQKLPARFQFYLESMSISLPRFLQGIWDIFGRAWFRRTWTLQEVVLAQNDPLILCGDSSLSWNCLTTAQSYLPYVLSSMAHNLKLPREFRTHAFIRNLFKLNAPFDARRLYQRSCKLPGRGTATDLYFLSLFTYHTKEQLCTDPRDKIYGLLGLIPERTRRYIQVDHTRSIKDVYTNLFSLLIQERDGFQVLSRATVPGLDEIPGWPTWLPRFDKYSTEAPSQLIREYHERCSVYRASLDLHPKYELIDSEQVLMLYGILVSEVDDVADTNLHRVYDTTYSLDGEYAIYDGESIGDIFMACKSHTLYPSSEKGHPDTNTTPMYCPNVSGSEWGYGESQVAQTLKYAMLSRCNAPLGCGLKSIEPFVLAEEESCRREGNWEYRIQEPMEEALWRTFLGGLQDVSENRFVPKSPWTTHTIDLQWGSTEAFGLFGTEESGGLQEAFRIYEREERGNLYRAMCHTIENRRAFRTSNGFIGFGPSTLKAGDKIVVIAGADVPFALRPRADGDGFTLVGECYVEGLMHGELFQKGTGWTEVKIPSKATDPGVLVVDDAAVKEKQLVLYTTDVSWPRMLLVGGYLQAPAYGRIYP
ncbi:hypothetical protein M426DRAFT_20900 [Hypoxylon sp. CI-4A]|nr:hypothetical protein M426DRAFT_20900 [Hypoxylon sp. CI-4A]